MPQVAAIAVAAVTAVTNAVIAAGPLAVAAFNTVNVIGAVAAGAVLTNALLQPSVASAGSATTFSSDPTAGIRGVMGRMAIGGNKIFERSWGKSNVYKTSVVLLSLGPILSIDSFSADKRFTTFNPTTGEASSPFNGKMWQTRSLGLPGTPALQPPSGVFNGSPPLTAWTSQHKTTGHVTAMWTLSLAEDERKRDQYPNGDPDPLWIGRWMKVWDPRQDSTYPGGSGAQRRDQWNTWGWTANPYLHALAWVRGHAKLNADGTVDRSLRLAGVGAPDAAIDISAFVEGANVCDANAWTAAGEWSTTDDKWQVLAAMLQAGGGVPLNRGAQISCMVNTPRVSIYSYSKADLVGDARLNVLTGRRDRKNTIVPRYRSEAHEWEYVAAAEVTSEVYRAEDGGEPRSTEIQYTYVTSPKQAAELAAYGVANSREWSGSLPSKPYLLGLRAGDAFTATVDDLGLSAQKFVVTRRAFEPQTGTVTLEVATETDGKHAWALGQTENPPPSASLTPLDPTYVEPPSESDWEIVVRPPAPDGSQLPGFDLSGVVGNPTADSILVEWALSTDGPWTQAYSGPSDATTIPIVGVDAGQTYFVAVTYYRGNNPSERRIFGPYMAPGLVAGDVNPDAPGLDTIKADVEAAFGDIFDVSDDLAEARALVDAQGTEIAAARNGEANLSARIAQVVQAQEDGDEASATAITNLNARTDGAEADIIDLELAQANETSARVASYNELIARSAHRPNLIDNPSGDADFRSWIKEGGPNSFVLNDTLAGRIFVVTDYMVSRVYPAAAGDQHSLSYNASPVGGGGVRLQYLTPGGAVEGVNAPNTLGPIDERRRSSAPSTAPAGTTGFRLVVAPPTGGSLPVWAIKVNFGAVATDFSDDYSATVLEASVTEQSLAIIDLEELQALASYQLIASATGGKPARLALVSSTAGSFIALDAPYIFWGDNTVFDDATDTLQTTVGANRRVLAFGAPFGASGDLLEWWGPSATALSAMTTANGLNGRMTTAPYVFDNVNASTAARKDTRSIVKTIGRSQASTSFDLDAITPGSSGGRWFITLNGLSRSSQDGSVSQIATGTLTLFRVIGGVETQVGDAVDLSTDQSLSVSIDFSGLNGKVANASASATTWRVKIVGGGGSSASVGTFRGSLTVEWFA